MLTPDQLEALPRRFVQLWQQVEDDILQDIARRMKSLGELDPLTPTAIWQAWRLAETRAVRSNTVATLAKYTGKSRAEIKRLLETAGAQTLAADDAVYTAAGLDPPPVNQSPALLNLLNAGYRQTCGTWQNLTATTANTVTGAFALLSLMVIAFGTPAGAKDVPVLTLVCIAVFVACTIAVAGAGHAVILKVQKWATWIFGGLTLAVGAYLATTIDWGSFVGGSAGPMSAVIIGIGTIASGTGIGWATSGADMARYQRKSVSGLSLILSAAAGAGIPLVIVIGLGSALTAGDSAIATAGDPIAAVREVLPAWVAVPYLIAAFGGLLLSNHLSVYSAGMATLNLGIRIPRVFAVLVDVVVTTLGAVYFMLISDGFYGPFITFISLLAVPLSAWIGIFLIDMMKRTTRAAQSSTS